MQTPHQRRQHSAQVAGVFTALAFVVWITTLGFRFSVTANGPTTVAGADGQSQTASVFDGLSPAENTLVPVGAAPNTNSDTSAGAGADTMTPVPNSYYSDYGGTQ